MPEDKKDATGDAVGENLMTALNSALEGDFNFKGAFAHAQTFPVNQTPNPCLSIEGLGIIGLPLNERDAKLIIQSSEQAPFGHGERTVVDTKVRDTWEIEPAKVKFENPEWNGFLHNKVVQLVCQALGVAPSITPPRCDLYKLLVYEKGSHFLPHQDTQKAEGMFATMIIILPSLYSGGQVCVSHASQSDVFDLSKSSLLSTSVLAWYTDVMHEVKPVTSGYRFALSYNLIHTSDRVPRPMLPDMNQAVHQLDLVLRKWKQDEYAQIPEQDLVAYLLRHKYSPANLHAGSRSLKGEDAHKIAHLKPIAEHLGFVVYLANLVYVVTGYGDDDCGYRPDPWKRYKHGYSDEEDDERDYIPGMAEVEERELTVDNIVDLDGNLIIGPKSLPLDSSNLIPEDPFDDATPDRREYEGYMGNGAGSLSHWYDRTVLILVREDKASEVFLSAGGAHYALQRLKSMNSLPPTDEDKKMVDLIVKTLNYDKSSTETIMDYAVKWGDAPMWKTVVERTGSSLSNLDSDKLIEGWRKFLFDNVRPSFETLLQRSPSLQDSLGFIESLSASTCPEDIKQIKAWCREMSAQALASYDSALATDVPILISMILKQNFSYISDLLSRLAKKTGTYSFLASFIRALYQNKQILIEHQQTKGEASGTSSEAQQHLSAEGEYNGFIDLSLDAAIMQWDTVVAVPRQHYTGQISHTQGDRIARVIELAELCLLTERIPSCERLFTLLLKVPGKPVEKLNSLWLPLLRSLQPLLSRLNYPIYSPPFLGLVQYIIASFLNAVLGTKPRKACPALRQIGCGCGDCSNIDNFMRSSQVTQTYRMAKARRLHVENRLKTAPDLVSFVTITTGTPHGVTLKKHPDFIASSDWETRRKKTETFLASIGNDDVLAKVMGRRYGDLQKALNGSQHFAVPFATSSENQPQTIVPEALTGVAPGVAVPPSVTAASAGQKRKKPPTNLGPVIDLTGEESS